MTTSIFTVAANLTTADLTLKMNNDWRLNWEPVLNNAQEELKFLPVQPRCEELDLYNSTLVKFVKTAAVLGQWAAERLNHDPWKPHLPGYVRPGASVFHEDFVEDILKSINPSEAVVTAVTGGPGVRIFTVRSGDTVGTNRDSLIVDTATYTMVAEHGTLLPKGPARESECLTNFISFIFTYEGPEHGWVLASAHPGVADPTPNLEGIKEGDQLTGAQLRERMFVRVIPG